MEEKVYGRLMLDDISFDCKYNLFRMLICHLYGPYRLAETVVFDTKNLVI